MRSQYCEEMSAGEARYLYNLIWHGSSCSPYFQHWWYWQETSTRPDGSRVMEYDKDYESFDNWAIRRNIPMEFR